MEKCPKCGILVNESGDCVVCDESPSVNPYAVSETMTASAGVEEIVQASEYSKIFVGSKYYSFFPLGNDIPKNWNWAAFFIGIFWFIYRKMYLYAAIFFGIEFLLNILKSMIDMPREYGLVATTGLYIAQGIIANRLYKQHIDKKIAGIVAQVKESDVVSVLEAKGGTNLAAVLSIFIVMVTVAVLYVLFEIRSRYLLL